MKLKKHLNWGIISGVTTNPSLVAKEKNVSFHDRLKEITDLVPGSVSAEVIATDAEGMIKEGRELAKIAPNITVKVPMTPDGLKACITFAKEGIKTNVTLIFSANQALLAASAGATYVSPFLGRLDDIGQDGLELVSKIAEIFAIHGLGNRNHCGFDPPSSACYGSSAPRGSYCNNSLKVLKQLFNHPLTDKGIEAFLNDWNNR